MKILQVENGKPIKLWTEGVPVEDAARLQLANTAAENLGNVALAE